MLSRGLLCAVVAIILSILGGCRAESAWEIVEALPRTQIKLSGLSVRAVIATSPDARAQGYQHLPRDEAPEAIHFIWPTVQPRVRFHMRNVAFPLHIFWLDDQHCVVGMELMTPGDEEYGMDAPVKSALEVPADISGASSVRTGDCIRQMLVF